MVLFSEDACVLFAFRRVMRLRVKVVKFSLIVVLAWVLDYMPTWKENPRGDFDIERRRGKLVSTSLFTNGMF
jgi:hypothetical protein